MRRILLLSSVLSLVACERAGADSVTLQNGYTPTGTILQTNHERNTILLLRDYGTASYYIPTIKAIKLDTEEVVSVPAVPQEAGRWPHWKHIGLVQSGGI
jgi:hypothetical protein